MTYKEWLNYKLMGLKTIPEYENALMKHNDLIPYLEAIKVCCYIKNEPTKPCQIELNEYTLDFIIQALKEWLELSKKNKGERK